VHDPARSYDGYAHVFNKADLSKSWFEKGGVAYVFTRVATPSNVALQPGERPSGAVPAAFVLHPAYPNPYSLSRREQGVTIAFDLLRPEVVSLAFYNAAGQLVRQVDAQHYPAGTHALRWQPEQEVGAGVYFYRLVVGRQVATGCCVVVP
jgi:hypothetical protein